MRLWKFSISSLSAAVPAGLLISILATEKKMLILSLFTLSESGKNIASPPAHRHLSLAPLCKEGETVAWKPPRRNGLVHIFLNEFS